MGRKENSFRRDNRGLTLIELLCSIAIFAFITAAIGSVLVVTAKTYHGGTTEATLQQEAQLAANIIEGLIVDAKKSINLCYYDGGGEHTVLDASSIPAGCDRKLKIADDGSNRTDIIYEASTKRLLYQKTVDGTTGERYVLANNVEEFGADLKGFDESHNVVLNIELKKDSRAFDAEYTVTTRNANVTTAPYVPDRWATISCDAEITLEPNQEYVLPVTVDANVSDKSYDIDLLNESHAGTTANYDTGGIRITVHNDETGSASNNMLLRITTNATQSDGSTPLAEKFVNIKIRRVDDIDVEFTPNGGSFTAGTVYTVNSTLTATPYLYQEVNEVGGAYVNPCDVDWSYQLSGGGVTAQSGSISGTTTTSYFKFTETPGEYGTPAKVTVELLAEMPSGSSLTVTGTAAHPSGGNKKSAEYKAGVVDSDTITNAAGPTPPVLSNMERGTEFSFATIETDTVLDMSIRDDNTPEGASSQYYWFWRYREMNDDGTYGAWEQYRKCTYSGSDKYLQYNETMCMRPDKAYEIEYISAVVDTTNMKLYWPKNTTLLETGKGFAEYGFTKGWDGADVQTAESEYVSTYRIGKTTISFGDSYTEASTSGITHLGTEANPIERTYPTSYTKYLDAAFIHFGNTQNKYKVLVEKKDAYGNWNLLASVPSWVQTGASLIINNYSSISGTEDYRLLYYIDDFNMKKMTGNLMDPNYQDAMAVDYYLYDIDNDIATVYLRLTKTSS